MKRRALTPMVVLGLALCAVAGAIPLTSGVALHPGVSSAIASVTLAALLGVGLYAWRRPGSERFGLVLIATGLCWFMASLSNSDGELLYSVGRIFAWLFEAMLVYALLAYPSGQLEGRAAKLVAVGGFVLVGVAFMPTIPFVDEYPLPSPFTDCGQQCPGNYFDVAAEPELIDEVVKPVRDTVTFAIYLAVAMLLAVRLQRSGRNLRRTETPVLAAAVLRFLAAGAYVTLRRAEASADVIQAAGFVGLLTISATAVGFLVGLLQWRIYSGGVLLRLTTGLNQASDPASLRSLVARCLDDSSVELYHTGPPLNGKAQQWYDSSGRPCAEPVDGDRTIVATRAQGDGSRLAISCDDGMRAYPHLLEAVCSCLVAGLERQRLDQALAASLQDVAASRKRLASAADSARRKIERDLHDGAQQHLVALRVKLELARDALERDPAPGSEVVARLGPEVDEIIEEVRALAHGIYPPLLASGGLDEALQAAARRSTLPVSVRAREVGRLPSEAESAVYFCCLEALQNAGKHAEGATRVVVELWLDDGLWFEVGDDGAGFVPDGDHAGSGIMGMKDRVEALGGWLRVESRLGEGTRVVGCVPQPGA